MDIDIQSMKFRNLQKLAKSYGIKANIKAEKLREHLLEYFSSNGIELNSVSNEFTNKDIRHDDSALSSEEDSSQSASDISQTDEGLCDDVFTNDSAVSVKYSKSSSVDESFSDEDLEVTFNLQKNAIINESSVCMTAEYIERDENVQKMLDCMDGDLTNEEMKANLMKQVNENARKKMDKISTSDSEASHIPRFVKHAEKNKKGNMFSKAHEEIFNKMESLEDYMERKRKRSASLRQKKATESEENSIMSPKVRNISTGKAAAKNSSQIQKSHHRTTSVPKSFIPQVMSTSKINMNFSRGPIDTTSINKAFVDRKKTPLKLNQMNNQSPNITGQLSAMKTRKSMSVSDRKSLGANHEENILKPSTPFRFGRSSPVVLSNSKRFDLGASLSKPLTWKPHTGKLKPLNIDFRNINGNTVPTETTAQKCRQKIRSQVQTTREDNRKKLSNKQRGISS